jgi:thermitase
MSVARTARFRPALLAALAVVLALPATAAADAAATPEQLEALGVRDLIVKRAPDLDAGERAQVRADAGVTLAGTLRLRDTEIVRAAPGRLTEALAVLRADPGVVYAEPNAPVRALTGDLYWREQWALENVGQTLNLRGAVPGLPGADIDAPEAWAAGATGAGQTVAVVDSGVNAAHPDIAGQLATNPGETGSGRERNGADDDNDLLVDDWRGWDWVDDDNDPDDAFGHGSHVAGIVAARQARRGISGVAPDARVLPLRVLDADGFGTLDDVANAYAYAGDLQARSDLHVGIVNASLGGPTTSQTEQDAIANHPDTLYVVAAGNGGSDHVGDDNDLTPTYPCAAPQPNIICVGATDNQDRPASFSNYGRTTVDLFAPGVQVLSAWRAPEFGWWYSDGTSMAAPHVAGTLALMRAAAPALDAQQLKQALLDSVDSDPLLTTRSVSGGRLNADAAVQRARLMSSQLHPVPDTDHDAVPDPSDNCPSVANATQSDGDGDGVGAACDPTPAGPDDDADGAPDSTDNCTFLVNPGQGDRDRDGLGDACDTTPDGADGDGDGVADAHDNCTEVANADQADADADGTGDACDATPGGTVPTPPPAALTAAPVVALAPLTPVPAPGGSAAPRLKALGSASPAATVRVCAPGEHGCRPRALTVTYSLDRAAPVTAEVQRRACRRGHCRYVTATTLRLAARAGANRLRIGGRGATAHLRPGSYRLRVVAGRGPARSAARTLAFRVR